MNDIKGLLFDLCEQRKLVGETGPLADLAGKIRLERSMEPRPPTKIDALLDKMGPLVEAEWNARGSDELVKELEETATTTVTA